MVTVGVSEALYLTMTAILDPGDEVIIPTPCFVAYQPEVVMAGGVPVEIPTRMEDNFQVDPARIRAAITPRTKAIFVGYPSNPTGAVASREVLTEIAQIAEENDLILISDEIYDRLVYGVQHVCVPALAKASASAPILLGGFSKDYAMTGWRIGYAAGPVRHHQGHDPHPSIQHHVRADHRPGCRHRGAGGRREIRAGDARRIRSPPPAAGGWLEQTRAQDLRAARRILRLPEHLRLRHGRRNRSARNCWKRNMWPLCPATRSAPAVRASSAPATPPSYEKIEEALRRMEKFMNRYG